MELFDGRYLKEELLGRGTFSEVWKVKDTLTGVTFALKIYYSADASDDAGFEMLIHEFTLMANVNHKNLVRPLSFSICNNQPYLLLTFCKQGNIVKKIGKMNEDEAWKLLRDCASALAYLHARKPPILHQDVKPANILLSDNGEYMLTDFGVSTRAKHSLSRVSNEEKELLTAGTISYMAPERFTKDRLPIMANDIYSLGSTIYEMISGILPFGNDGGLLQLKGAEIPNVPDNFSPLMKQTLEKCLEKEPWDRPTAASLEEIAIEALKHPETRNIMAATQNVEPHVETSESQQFLMYFATWYSKCRKFIDKLLLELTQKDLGKWSKPFFSHLKVIIKPAIPYLKLVPLAFLFFVVFIGFFTLWISLVEKCSSDNNEQAFQETVNDSISRVDDSSTFDSKEENPELSANAVMVFHRVERMKKSADSIYKMSIKHKDEGRHSEALKEAKEAFDFGI